MKNTFSISLLAFLSLASGCNINLTNSNVCPVDIKPFFTIHDNKNPSIKDEAFLKKIDREGSVILNYKLQYVQRYDNDENAYIRFNYDDEFIKSGYTYKLTYGNNAYFIHDINFADDTIYNYCDKETTYKINDCDASGYNIHIDPTCSISVDQADDYFEKNIKPTLN